MQLELVDWDYPRFDRRRFERRRFRLGNFLVCHEQDHPECSHSQYKTHDVDGGKIWTRQRIFFFFLNSKTAVHKYTHTHTHPCGSSIKRIKYGCSFCIYKVKPAPKCLKSVVDTCGCKKTSGPTEDNGKPTFHLFPVDILNKSPIYKSWSHYETSFIHRIPTGWQLRPQMPELLNWHHGADYIWLFK